MRCDPASLGPEPPTLQLLIYDFVRVWYTYSFGQVWQFLDPVTLGGTAGGMGFHKHIYFVSCDKGNENKCNLSTELVTEEIYKNVWNINSYNNGL